MHWKKSQISQIKLKCHVFWMASFVSGWYFKTWSTACKTKGSFSILHYLITITLLWLNMPLQVTLISKWFVTFITRILNLLMLWLHMHLQITLISKLFVTFIKRIMIFLMLWLQMPLQVTLISKWLFRFIARILNFLWCYDFTCFCKLPWSVNDFVTFITRITNIFTC